MAELSIGLAGFAGVAAAFGGRSREYGPVDLNRLKTLFMCAGSVVAGSLAVVTMAELGIERSTIFVTISAVLALVLGSVGLVLLLSSVKTYRKSPETVPVYVPLVGTFFYVIGELLLALNVFTYGEPGLLLAAFSLALIYGLWMFVRLMTHPN